MRIDLYLFQNNYTKSRQKAKDLIEKGSVILDGITVNKPSFEIDVTKEHSIIINDDCQYVSRGGLKLEALLNQCKYLIQDKICIDIGASTGGFTHCLLLNGAKKVYAIDSGTSQLDPMLKEDARVTSIEGLNARNISIEDIDEIVDVITIDVSFISQTLIVPSAIKLLKTEGVYLSLIKPQFEAGKSNIGKGGIVKDKKARLQAVQRVIDACSSLSLKCITFIKSPILGGDGNVEYLALFSRVGEEINSEIIKKIVLNT